MIILVCFIYKTPKSNERSLPKTIFYMSGWGEAIIVSVLYSNPSLILLSGKKIAE